MNFISQITNIKKANLMSKLILLQKKRMKKLR